MSRHEAAGAIDPRFRPSADTSCILHALIDLHERRGLARRARGIGDDAAQALRVFLRNLALPSYFDQTDPRPRSTTNEQLQRCAEAGWLRLDWQHLAEGELLERVELAAGGDVGICALLGRKPEALHRAGLAETLLGQRFRFEPGDWRRKAIDDVLRQIEGGRSPKPFDSRDLEHAEDLLRALASLELLEGETAYRVFSVRVFSDSKRFEAVAPAVATLARRTRPELRGWSTPEVLRELGVVPNPSLLLLRGDWRAVDDDGRVMEIGAFDPAVGVTARQVEHLVKVRVEARRVICVENLTSFFELAAASPADQALLCLSGNPGPAPRRLLRLLDRDRPRGQDLLAWNDIDYGGLNILAQLRQRVSPEIGTWRMDRSTLDAHARWGRPLTSGDRSGLLRLAARPEIADHHALIAHMLERNLKLEQEAIAMDGHEGDGDGH